MTCWQLLGIVPTQDRKQIKRAYSKLLKVTRPDDDLEAFQVLNEAYEQALDWNFTAEPAEYIETELETEIQNKPETKQDIGPVIAEIDQQAQDSKTSQPQISEVISDVFEKFGRILEQGDQADWQAFFDRDELNDLEFKPALGFEFFASIVNHVQEHNELPISTSLGKALAEHFMWHEQELHFCHYFNADTVGLTLTLLQGVELEQDDIFIPPPAKPKKPIVSRVKKWLHMFALGYFLLFVVKILIALAGD